MIQTTIYFIRHGQTEWNLETRMQGHKDSPLTKLGICQAQKLHDRLNKEKIDLIYSSKSKRAYKTAKIIKGDLNIPLCTKNELREINMGEWEGMKQSDIINKYPQIWNNFWNNPIQYTPVGGGESYDKFKNRIITEIENIINSNPGKNIAIVTHKIALKVIMLHFNNENIINTNNIPDIDPASLSQICINDGVYEILLYGDTSHYK
jgi:probable phosphoglycerate mutase